MAKAEDDMSSAVDVMLGGMQEAAEPALSTPVSDYFAKARLTRQQSRDQALSLLETAAAAETASQEVIDSAMSQITGMANASLLESKIENELLAIVLEAHRNLTPQVSKHLVCAVFVYAVDRQPLVWPAFAPSVVVDVENRHKSFRHAHVDDFLNAVEERRAYLVLRIVHAELTPPRHRQADGVYALRLVQPQEASGHRSVSPLRLVAARTVQRVADVYAEVYRLYELRRAARERRSRKKPHRADERAERKYYGYFAFHVQHSIIVSTIAPSPTRMMSFVSMVI